MELSNRINLADPTIRRAFYEAGKWGRLIAIISGIFLVFAALVVVGMVLFAPGIMSEAFLDNPMLAGTSTTYLGVLYSATLLLGIFVSIKLFLFGKLLKGAGPMQPLGNGDINIAFGHLVDILKYYVVFSVLSLIGSLVMLFM